MTTPLSGRRRLRPRARAGVSAAGASRSLPAPQAPARTRAGEAALDPELAARLCTQSYAPGARIEGVEFHPLERFVDDGGSFLELARLNSGHLAAAPGFEVRQISCSVLLPGTLKAFHLHLRQAELWFVPPEARLLVGLVDSRGGSPTARVSMRFVLGDGQARLLYIPAGVAHGVANQSGAPAPLFYFADRQFDPHPARCDEKRLPWDLLGADFWERSRG